MLAGIVVIKNVWSTCCKYKSFVSGFVHRGATQYGKQWESGYVRIRLRFAAGFTWPYNDQKEWYGCRPSFYTCHELVVAWKVLDTVALRINMRFTLCGTNYGGRVKRSSYRRSGY